MSEQKKSLLSLTLDELTEVAVGLGLPRFAGKQLCEWIYVRKAKSIDEMTNLSKAARELLKESYTIGASDPVDAMHSKDGTVKYLFRTREGHFVETVYIPDYGRDGRREEGGFACAVFAHQRVDFALSQRKIHILQSLDAGEVFANAAHFQYCAVLHIVCLHSLCHESPFGNFTTT